MDSVSFMFMFITPRRQIPRISAYLEIETVTKLIPPRHDQVILLGNVTKEVLV